MCKQAIAVQVQRTLRFPLKNYEQFGPGPLCFEPLLLHEPFECFEPSAGSHEDRGRHPDAGEPL
jgi:hypothetical protein